MVLLIGAQCLRGIGTPIYSINQLSVRQMMTPDWGLGRVNASHRCIIFGISPIRALLGGALGELIGLRWTLVTADASINRIGVHDDEHAEGQTPTPRAADCFARRCRWSAMTALRSVGVETAGSSPAAGPG
jgi:hypothetical protein